MTPSAPWSPTAHAFAQHQLSHVVNFWKQGRLASYRLEALPGGRAALNVTFQLPHASEVIPPPFHPVPTHQRTTCPLFPGGFSPQGPASGTKKGTNSPEEAFLQAAQKLSPLSATPGCFGCTLPSSSKGWFPAPCCTSLCSATASCFSLANEQLSTHTNNQVLGVI